MNVSPEAPIESWVGGCRGLMDTCMGIWVADRVLSGVRSQDSGESVTHTPLTRILAVLCHEWHTVPIPFSIEKEAAALWRVNDASASWSSERTLRRILSPTSVVLVCSRNLIRSAGSQSLCESISARTVRVHKTTRRYCGRCRHSAVLSDISHRMEGQTRDN